MMGDLSPHFSAVEFECRCGGGVSDIHPHLLSGLESLRVSLGVPLLVTSGRRGESHNRDEGGKANSYHLFGMAADIVAEWVRVHITYSHAKTIPEFINAGIGLYPTFIHVDVRPYHARWFK